MTKSNSKSIRISDEVLDFIMDFKGEGFNQKLENLVLDCKHTIAKRQEEAQYLDDMIKEKKELLQQVESRINSLEKLEFSLDKLRRDILSIHDRAEKLSV